MQPDQPANALLTIAIALPCVALGAVLAITNRRLLLLALPYLATLNGVAPRVGGQRVRLDQLATVLLCAGLLPALLTGRRRLRFDAVTGWILVLAGLNVLSTLLNSPAKGFSLMQLLNVGSSWAVYFVLLNCLTTAKDLDRFVVHLLIAGTAAASFGIVTFMLGSVGLDVGVSTVGEATGSAQAFGALGTFYEPNVFGGYCAWYFVLALGLMWIVPRAWSSRRRALVRAALATSALGLLLSFTRGAWLGAGVGLFVLAVLARVALGRKGPMVGLAVTMLAAAVVVAMAVTLPGAIGEAVRYKISNLLNPQSETAMDRFATYIVAWSQYVQHPILGWGTYTFQPLVAGAGFDFKTLGGGIWIGNFVLLTLHDTGAVGLAAFLALLVAVFRSGLRASRILWRFDQPSGATVLSATAAAMGLTLAFVFTTAFEFGFPWVFLGTVGAYAQLAREVSRQPAT